MDHGFAPGVSPFDKQYFNLLDNRKTAAFDTSLDSAAATPPLLTVADLWLHLLTHPTGPGARPIGDVILVSHGNETGSMVLKLIKSPAARTDYDELLRIQGNAQELAKVEFPAILRKTPQTGQLKDIKIHIRGCRIGQDAKYMNRLQDVLGDKVAITAPLHLAGVMAIFDGKRHIIDPPSHGFMEFLMYDFEIKSNTRFADRATLVQAFKNAKHKFIDGSQVPDALWEPWIPKTKFNDPKVTIDMPFLSLGNTIESTNTTVKLPRVKKAGVPGTFEHYPYTQTVAVTRAAKPKPADHRKIILDELRTNAAYTRADHPLHESLGFANLEAYVDAFTWVPTWIEGKKSLTLVGTYHYYNVQIPICDPTVGKKDDPKTWQLIHNFYPLRSLPLNAFESLSATDGRLFFTALP